MARILVIAVALVAVAALVWRPAQAPAVVSVASSAPRVPHAPARLSPSPNPVVYVAGAVLHPGVYTLRRGDRADDAVRRAGGFRSDADTGAINLAARVGDGDEVFAPVLGQPTPRPARTRSSTRTARTTKKSSTAVVNVNTASAAELASVPGIGATLAARIVDVRERDGAYRSYDELLDVAGMTAARLARAEPNLQI